MTALDWDYACVENDHIALGERRIKPGDVGYATAHDLLDNGCDGTDLAALLGERDALKAEANTRLANETQLACERIDLKAENAQLREALRRTQEIAQTSVMLAKGGGKPDHYEALRDIRALLSTAIAKVTR